MIDVCSGCYTRSHDVSNHHVQELLNVEVEKAELDEGDKEEDAGGDETAEEVDMMLDDSVEDADDVGALDDGTSQSSTKPTTLATVTYGLSADLGSTRQDATSQIDAGPGDRDTRLVEWPPSSQPLYVGHPFAGSCASTRLAIKPGACEPTVLSTTPAL